LKPVSTIFYPEPYLVLFHESEKREEKQTETTFPLPAEESIHLSWEKHCFKQEKALF